MSRSALRPVTGYPAGVADAYRARGYWRTDVLDDLLATTARRAPDATALVAVRAADARTQVRLTYADLDEQAGRAAATFEHHGVAPGDRAVVQLPNCAELLVAVLGLFRLGALPVFALPAHREAELTHFCRTTDAAAHVVAGVRWGHDHRATAARVAATLIADGLAPPALVDVETWDLAAAPPREREPSDATDVAFLQLSGGTTGTPKLIARTHADYLYSVRASVTICGVDESTVMLVPIPATHNFAMSSPGMLGVIAAGGTIVLAPDASPRTAFRLIESEAVTTAPLVPPLLMSWLSSGARRRHDLSSLRTVLVGGARLPDTVAARVAPELGARLQQVFGMAEGLVCYTRLDDPDDLVGTTQGRPISPDDEILIVDEDDRPVPPGEEGDLLTRGPYTIRGYYDDADPGSFTADGFYRTGDRVAQLPSGHLRVTGRSKDQINRGGEKIAVVEVENALLAHSGVHDAAVVGEPDRYLGERAVAFVVGAGDERGVGPDAVALAEHLRTAGLAAYKIPDRFEVVEAFPTTGVGKTSRADLRRALARELTERSTR